MNHSINFRVYYEDTDAGGVVYYANYLKYAERSRTEMLREHSIIQSDLAEKQGLYFVVRSCNMELKSPAKLDDILEIKTSINTIKGASIEVFQEISKSENSEPIAEISVKIACINSKFQPARIPEDIRNILKFNDYR